MGGSGSKAGAEEGVPPDGPDLFAELGVALIDRPSGAALREVWADSDADMNDVLSRAELRVFLAAVSAKWGGGKWTAADFKAGSLSFAAWGALEEGEEVEWQAVRSALWDPPWEGVRGPAILALQTEFNAAAGHRPDASGHNPTLPDARAQRVAEKLLSGNDAGDDVRRAVASALELEAGGSTTGGGAGVDFEAFVKIVGKPFQESARPPDAGLRGGWRFCGVHRSKNDMALDGVVESFRTQTDDRTPAPPRLAELSGVLAGPERANSPCEVLLCGEDCLGAMLEEIKAAKSEIMMVK